MGECNCNAFEINRNLKKSNQTNGAYKKREIHNELYTVGTKK